MPGHGPVLGLGRALADRERLPVRARALPGAAPRGLRWRRFRLSWRCRSARSLPAGLHIQRLVDRLVAHPLRVVRAVLVPRASSAISPGDQPWSIHPSIRRHSPGFSTSLNGLGPTPPLVRGPVRDRPVVGAVRAGVAVDLTADHRLVPTDQRADRGIGQLPASPAAITARSSLVNARRCRARPVASSRPGAGAVTGQPAVSAGLRSSRSIQPRFPPPPRPDRRRHAHRRLSALHRQPPHTSSKNSSRAPYENTFGIATPPVILSVASTVRSATFRAVGTPRNVMKQPNVCVTPPCHSRY